MTDIETDYSRLVVDAVNMKPWRLQFEGVARIEDGIGRPLWFGYEGSIAANSGYPNDGSPASVTELRVFVGKGSLHPEEMAAAIEAIDLDAVLAEARRSAQRYEATGLR